LLEEMSAFKFPDRLTASELQRLRQLDLRLDGIGSQLHAIGVPPMVQCDYLHGWNEDLSPDGYQVLDWGDASIAHPFGSLLVLERRLAEHLQLAPGDAGLMLLRRVHRETFQGYTPLPALLRAAQLALWSAPLVRALT
jgi:hypothetical protein